VNGGVFAGAYGIEADLDELVEVDVRIPGCPPQPTAITEALRGLTGR
jgi:Ni,Fe-hydrogenase III small subunit